MANYEKPLKGNPQRLTINQHVFSSASIARFANANGGVQVHDVLRGKRRTTSSDDVIFCARRAWDQRAEIGYMKQIEDEFQPFAERVIAGFQQRISPHDKSVVDHFFALWKVRADNRKLDQQEYQLKGVTGGGFSKEMEEELEAHGVLYVRTGGRAPMRHLNGITMQMKIDNLIQDNLGSAQWGILRSLNGEFIVPDSPVVTMVPLTPTLCLASPATNMSLGRTQVASINRDVRDKSIHYYFGRDFDLCPF